MKYYLAVDIGASSGRHIVGWQEQGETKTEEVYRFPNFMDNENGHLVWNTERLMREVKKGIEIAKERFESICCLSVDTWGVDYILMNGDREISPCYAYRDHRTETIVPLLHEIIPFDELYSRTGIQFQPFNTIYQLYCDKTEGRLDNATDFLMLPEYISYKLAGVKKKEYTNSTTTGLINVYTQKYDTDIIHKLGLPDNLFGELTAPGTALGEYDGIKVLLCASHDTASAVEGIPMPDTALFLSSGTWSLLGAKTNSPITTKESRRANFTNEGGVGYIRYLKNIMGLWIVQNLQKQMKISFDDMVRLSRTSHYEKIFDVNDSRFSAPIDMKAEIISALGDKDLSDADIINSAYHSLAYCCGNAVKNLEKLLGQNHEEMYIVGGGAKNHYLNELMGHYTNKRIIALPIEATALGNLKVQMEAYK